MNILSPSKSFVERKLGWSKYGEDLTTTGSNFVSRSFQFLAGTTWLCNPPASGVLGLQVCSGVEFLSMRQNFF